jgi:CheY-like chemotaxis protein
MSPCVYLVDDDEAIRDSLGWLLESRGVACLSHPSAEDFLAAWTPALAGCLLLDIRMDGMSGPELFDLLRERGSRLPVIFLTGHGDVPMAVSALKKGAFENRVGGLLEQAKTSATEIHWRDAKIEKLTLELAHLRRMKFGVKSEAMVAAERDLFDENLAADIAACEARLARSRSLKRRRINRYPRRSPNANAPVVSPCRSICRALKFATNPRTTCGECGQALVLIGEDVTEKLNIVPASSSSNSTFIPNTPAGPARR